MMMFGVSENIWIVLVNSMEKRKTKLTSEGGKLVTVRIKSGIFQEES